MCQVFEKTNKNLAIVSKYVYIYIYIYCVCVCIYNNKSNTFLLYT